MQRLKQLALTFQAVLTPYRCAHAIKPAFLTTKHQNDHLHVFRSHSTVEGADPVWERVHVQIKLRGQNVSVLGSFPQPLQQVSRRLPNASLCAHCKFAQTKYRNMRARNGQCNICHGTCDAMGRPPKPQIPASQMLPDVIINTMDPILS